MKIKLLVSRAGPGGVENRGDVVDVGKDEAKRMIESNQAIPYDAKVKPETRKNVGKGKRKN